MQARVREHRWQCSRSRRLVRAMGRLEKLKKSIVNQALETAIQAAEGTQE